MDDEEFKEQLIRVLKKDDADAQDQATRAIGKVIQRNGDGSSYTYLRTGLRHYSNTELLYEIRRRKR